MDWRLTVAAAIGLPVSLPYLIDYLLSLHRRVDVRGRAVLITGASSGLGRACAEVFYSAGCKVILAGRNKQELEKLQKELMETNNRDYSSSDAKILLLDLMDLKNMTKVAGEAASLFGAIGILINNAGMSYRGSIEDTDIEVHQKLMTVNYFGQVALTKAVLPHITDRGGGHIIAVSSLQGRFSIPYRSAYSASKHAMQAFFDCLRAEVSDRNIKVCVVSPGYIKTNLSQNAVCADGSIYGVLDSTTAKGRPASEVAAMILQAVQGSKSEIIPAPLLHRLIIAIRALFPNVFFKVMNSRANKQRSDYIKQR